MDETREEAGTPGRWLLASDDQFLAAMQQEASGEARRLGARFVTADLFFAVFLRRFARFGYFSFGPITIDVRVITDIVEATIERDGAVMHVYGDDFVRFSATLADELRRSGHRRLDELHMLLAFMRFGEGLPARVFGELGVTPEQIEEFAREVPAAAPVQPEKLYSPEEAAEYLGVHVQTVRAWIRTGRLRARRLAGQRALRITLSDLQSVLQPVDPSEIDA